MVVRHVNRITLSILFKCTRMLFKRLTYGYLTATTGKLRSTTWECGVTCAVMTGVREKPCSYVHKKGLRAVWCLEPTSPGTRSVGCSTASVTSQTPRWRIASQTVAYGDLCSTVKPRPSSVTVKRVSYCTIKTSYLKVPVLTWPSASFSTPALRFYIECLVAAWVHNLWWDQFCICKWQINENALLRVDGLLSHWHYSLWYVYDSPLSFRRRRYTRTPSHIRLWWVFISVFH